MGKVQTSLDVQDIMKPKMSIPEEEKVFVASNSSGWMTEDMFVLWSLFVASHVSNYR